MNLSSTFCGLNHVQVAIYRVSFINTAFLIGTPVPVLYYLNTNNIDVVVIFISSAPWNITTCHFVTLGITANYCVTMIISSIIFEL